MKKILFGAGFFLIVFVSTAQSKDERAIRELLDLQTKAWNRGDIESFMKGYWQNDSLMFIGRSGVTYGWNNTLNNYKKNYPGKAGMGELSFDILIVKRLSTEYFHVTGKWHLLRKEGNLDGYYTLLFRKINGNWLIVADHSS